MKSYFLYGLIGGFCVLPLLGMANEALLDQKTVQDIREQILSEDSFSDHIKIRDWSLSKWEKALAWSASNYIYSIRNSTTLVIYDWQDAGASRVLGTLMAKIDYSGIRIVSGSPTTIIIVRSVPYIDPDNKKAPQPGKAYFVYSEEFDLDMNEMLVLLPLEFRFMQDVDLSLSDQQLAEYFGFIVQPPPEEIKTVALRPGRSSLFPFFLSFSRLGSAGPFDFLR